MKKLSIIFLLLFAAQFINAQVSYGIKSGVNLSKINHEIIDYDFKTGFYAGGFVNIKFAKKFAFQPELLFSMQGGKKDDIEVYSLVGNEIIAVKYSEIKNNLSYINFPLMLKFYAMEELSFEFGPQVGFAVQNEVKTKSGEYGNQKIKVDSNIDLGLNVGIEYIIHNGLGITSRYNLGLSNITKNSNLKNKNSIISLGISYSFN